ncbi:MAG TPA: AMP-binding protein [Longimicrobiales bacterium]|nr:AMP-binding protein [Longimicrobiales bacterium]
MDLLRNAARVPPEKPVLVSGHRAWTREELASQVRSRAREVTAELPPGSIRPLTLHPDEGGVVELLATWVAGGVPAPLSPQLTPAERGAALAALAGTPASDLPRGAVAVLWTSGTSGSPRGVVLSDAGLRASAAASRERLGLTASDVWYASLSPAHVGGLALVTRALLLGSTLVAEGGAGLEPLLTAIRGTSSAPPATHLSLVPTQLHRLLDAWGEAPPPPTHRCLLMGGAATPAPLLARALNAGWPVALTYGMTEMTSQLCTAPPDRVREKPGTVGRPLPGNEIALAEDGEILARGATLAAGFVGTGAPLLDDEGWYPTGDLGRLDEDGDLWVVGRKSDRIMSGGVTVDPHEVEAALREHPAVRDVCVVGLPDPEWGERLAALVVRVTGDASRREDGGAAPDHPLAAWARKRLGAARLPRTWGTAPALPLNRNGKVDRDAVRDLLLAKGRG